VDIVSLKAIARIRYSDDGSDLLNYLDELSKGNYINIKYCDPTLREIYVGRAQAIDEIKDFILSADTKCKEATKEDPSLWSL
jgi:hypothetical protein